MNLSDWLIVIPARLESQRLKEKPLQLLGSKPLIVRVVENVKSLELVGAKVIVAVDDEKVLNTLKDHDIEALMTSADHISGTDRIHEAAQNYEQKFIMNVQGDEPFIDCSDLIFLMNSFEKLDYKMGTLLYKSSDENNYNDPNTVKAITNEKNEAIYFSRSPIPHERSGAIPTFNEHLGVYCFSKDGLSEFCDLAPSALEKSEKLEQLRAISNGIKILCIEAKSKSIGIDTEKDLEEANKIFKEENQ